MDRGSEMMFEFFADLDKKCRAKEQAEVKKNEEDEKALIQSLIDDEELSMTCPECGRPYGDL